MSKVFFVSCAIDYPNAKLHMGHIYEKTIADVIARIHRLNGEKVLFSVGVDEHGEKVQKAAKGAGMETQQYVDQMAVEFQRLFDMASISYDTFIRTTNSEHVKAAQFFFQSLFDADDIYPDMYEGWYCVSDETFWTEKDLVDRDGKKFCPNPHCGKEVEKVKEESYFFKWSAYQEKLEQWYAQHSHNIFPPFRKNEMEQFMKKGLNDISFSRKSVSWGVPTPINKDHTIYVWGDALVNYLTVCGYPDKSYTDYWPADVHVIGMDISRFHSLLWPAMLMSVGIALPKQILVHGFVNDEHGEKMSKSKGNVVDPLLIMEKYGVEPLRYYLLRESPLGNDMSFSEKNLIERNNTELADGLGNLVYRVLSMIEKYCNSVIPLIDLDMEILSQSNEHAQQSYLSFLSHDIQNGLQYAWKIVALGNKYIADKEPWKLMKEGKRAEVEKLLATEVELLRQLSILIYPVLPKSSVEIRTQFGLDEPHYTVLQHPAKMGEKKIRKGNVLFVKREFSPSSS
ncbi:MAG: methionine--tRNA ligase [Candidatus Diapherotrites archaeon]